MAPTPLTPTRIVLNGVTPATEAAIDAANGNVINNNDGRSIWVEITSTHATDTITVAFDTPGTVGSQALDIAQDSHTIAANGVQKRYGPFPVAVYGASIGISWTGTGTATIAAYQLSGA